jgi:hypothetical protein
LSTVQLRLLILGGLPIRSRHRATVHRSSRGPRETHFGGPRDGKFQV